MGYVPRRRGEKGGKLSSPPPRPSPGSLRPPAGRGDQLTAKSRAKDRKSGGPKGEAPKGGGPKGGGAQNFALFIAVRSRGGGPRGGGCRGRGGEERGPLDKKNTIVTKIKLFLDESVILTKPSLHETVFGQMYHWMKPFWDEVVIG